jgi:hypothetical protein
MVMAQMPASGSGTVGKLGHRCRQVEPTTVAGTARAHLHPPDPKPRRKPTPSARQLYLIVIVLVSRRTPM